jgi:hypothetical protein
MDGVRVNYAIRFSGLRGPVTRPLVCSASYFAAAFSRRIQLRLHVKNYRSINIRAQDSVTLTSYVGPTADDIYVLLL